MGIPFKNNKGELMAVLRDDGTYVRRVRISKHQVYHSAGAGWSLDEETIRQLDRHGCTTLRFEERDDGIDYQTEYARFKRYAKKDKHTHKTVLALRHFEKFKDGELIGKKKPPLKPIAPKKPRVASTRPKTRKIALSTATCTGCNATFAELSCTYCTACRLKKAEETRVRYNEWKAERGLPVETKEEELNRILKENEKVQPRDEAVGGADDGAREVQEAGVV